MDSRYLMEPGYVPSARTVVASRDCDYLFFGGFCDNSIRVLQSSSRQCVAVGIAHRLPVTCLAIDYSSNVLLTGSRDRTCVLWDIVFDNSGIAPQLIQRHVYFGHSQEVSSVSVSAEFDLIVSASLDGTMNLHTLHKAMYVDTIYPQEVLMPRLTGNSKQHTSTGSTLSHIAPRIFSTLISCDGIIAIGCAFNLSLNRSKRYCCVSIFSCNGKFLAANIDFPSFKVMAWMNDGTHLLVGGRTAEVAFLDSLT